MQKKILIFGNGLDCTYNEYVQNFNQNFKKFISLENENKMYDILDYYDKCKCENSLIHLDSIIKELRRELENLKDDFSLEDVLFKIGNRIVESWNNSNIEEKNGKVAEIFHIIQNLIGAFVFWSTIGSTIKFEAYMERHHDDELFGNIYRPNLILTTNYTKSAEAIANYFNSSSSLYAPIETKYLHGKIKTPLTDDSFRSIEINLKKKDETKLKEIFKHYSEKDEFQVKVFGLATKNDNSLFHNLIWFLSGMKENNKTKIQKFAQQNELIYYYFSSEDKENFISLLSKNKTFLQLEHLAEQDNFEIINRINNTTLNIKLIESGKFEWNDGFKKTSQEL